MHIITIKRKGVKTYKGAKLRQHVRTRKTHIYLDTAGDRAKNNN